MTAAARDLVRASLAPLSREQVDVAIPLLREALAIDPTDADAQALLATALVATGQVNEGLALAEAAARAAPGAFLPRLKAGELGVRLGDLAGAEAHFLAALAAADPGSRDAVAAKALLADVRGRSRRSIDHHAHMPSFRVGMRLRAVLARRQVPAAMPGDDADDDDRSPEPAVV